ncbi:hypothetical protein [Streptomyces justiciae]|uniref:Uncharacterized protein n=1 Tax=Streptomyces justiciae TaxID=2780140 RepID=A0ABU3LTG6_9ACTN|nr:hypothetical protein [Streptomyces justiciae]MDT7842510.1 hypothetical protein [Streptomyces justiciae]
MGSAAEPESGQDASDVRAGRPLAWQPVMAAAVAAVATVAAAWIAAVGTGGPSAGSAVQKEDVRPPAAALKRCDPVGSSYRCIGVYSDLPPDYSVFVVTSSGRSIHASPAFVLPDGTWHVSLDDPPMEGGLLVDAAHHDSYNNVSEPFG